MKSKRGLGGPNVIRLWAPYPNLNLDRKQQEKHCSPGDVGTFASDGSFSVLFNIFMSMEENNDMDYHPPPNFQPFVVGRHKNYKRPRLYETTYTSSNFVTSQTDIPEGGPNARLLLFISLESV